MFKLPSELLALDIQGHPEAVRRNLTRYEAIVRHCANVCAIEAIKLPNSGPGPLAGIAYDMGRAILREFGLEKK